MLNKEEAINLLHRYQDSSNCLFGFKEFPDWMIAAVQEASSTNHISKTFYNYDTETLGSRPEKYISSREANQNLVNPTVNY